MMEGSADLVSPLIDDGHIDVIYKHRHLPTSWWPICIANTLVHIALNSTLQREIYIHILQYTYYSYLKQHWC